MFQTRFHVFSTKKCPGPTPALNPGHGPSAGPNPVPGVGGAEQAGAGEIDIERG